MECIVCVAEPAKMVPLVCGHLAMCKGCWLKWAEKQQTCPMCKLPVEEVVEVFY